MKIKLFWIFSLSYVLLFGIPYAVIPYAFAYSQFPVFVGLLANITVVSIIVYSIALNVPFGPAIAIPRLMLNFDIVVYLLFSIFLLLIAIIFGTAPRIPIIESFRGADAADLSQYREDFLKARVGWESSLGYLIGAVNGAALPYFIALAFLRNHKFKYYFALIFLLYCISFLEKAYFLKLAIPLFFIYLINAKNKVLFLAKGVGIIVLLLVFMYSFAGSPAEGNAADEAFFSLVYTPGGTFETILWRAAVVPVITALDGIRVFVTEFNGEFFYGRTSSFIAFLTGGERINFERYLYQNQFGGNETGNANAYYLIEAFINFGYTGVIIFSSLVGRIVRSAILKDDIAFLSIMPLFLINLFSAGFIGTLLSNGFIILIVISRYMGFK